MQPQPQTIELHNFLLTLNDEADTAAQAFAALEPRKVDEWAPLFEANPSWCRFGTFDALLQYGRSIIYREPKKSLEIALFVQSRADSIPVAQGAELLKPLLAGSAAKEVAGAYYALQRNHEGLAAIEGALRAFETHPELVVDYAAALLVYAQLTHALADTVGALEAVQEAAGTFDAHAQAQKYLQALEVCGGILVDQAEYLVAQDVYRTAADVAERLDRFDDPQTPSRLDHARGICAFYLGELDEATRLLTRAFVGFEADKMYAALHKTIWGIARIARERGDLDDALDALEGVYAEFLHRGMIAAAAEVLVELSDVVAEMRADVGYAREMSRRLAETVGTCEVAPNVREVVEYLRRTTRESTTVETLRPALDHARHFFQQYDGSPSATFVASS